MNNNNSKNKTKIHENFKIKKKLINNRVDDFTTLKIKYNNYDSICQTILSI